MTNPTRLCDDLEARLVVYRHTCRGVQLLARSTLAFARELAALGEKVKKSGDAELAKRYEAIADEATALVESYPDTVNHGLAQQGAAMLRGYRELLEQLQQVTDDEGAVPL